jgi:hypothetical protein
VAGDLTTNLEQRQELQQSFTRASPDGQPHAGGRPAHQRRARSGAVHNLLVIREHLGGGTNALDQSQTVLPYKYTIQVGGTSPSSMQQVAQVVTAGQSGILDHVSIYADSMQTTSSGPAPLVTASIQTVSNGLPSGTIIGSGSIPITDLPAGSSWLRNPAWVTIKLSPAGGASLAITPGTQYAIVLSAGGGIITWYGSDDLYTGGSMVFPYTSGWHCA